MGPTVVVTGHLARLELDSTAKTLSLMRTKGLGYAEDLHVMETDRILQEKDGPVLDALTMGNIVIRMTGDQRRS